jgi:20S proteasome subunit alpha 6
VSNLCSLSQEKVFKIDQHLGVSVSGLIADARVLSKFMHSEALNHRFVFSSDMQVARLVQMVADKSQVRAHFL